MKGWRAGLFIAFIGLATCVQLALGVWQWSRMGEKEAYLRVVGASALADPKPISDAKMWDRVVLHGRYRTDKALHVLFSRPSPERGVRDQHGRVPASGFGVLVMTPFDYEDCQPTARDDKTSACDKKIIFVNRGFLPTPPNGAVPAIETAEGGLDIIGFLRPSEVRATFQPGNDRDKKIFFLRDLNDLAAVSGIGAINTSFYVDRQALPHEMAPPIGVDIKEFLKGIPNSHYGYALTWFALAATNLGILLIFLIQGRNNRANKIASENA